MAKAVMTYSEAVEAIEKIGRFSAKHSNEHTRKCLHLLGDPDRAFSCIHVAGTNGKGSTCAYLASVFRESGRKTGLFTSPHLVEIRERMVIGGEMISEEEFVRVFLEVCRVADRMEEAGDERPSYFEFLFLMAAKWFADQGIEIAVIETGLGGRLDATNALEHPLLSVITSISFDHMQYLGNTIEEIAGEKAGILRADAPAVIDGSRPKAQEVLIERARLLGTEFHVLKPEDYEILSFRDGVIDFSTVFRYDGVSSFSVRACAPYQAENASLAILTLKTLKERDPERFSDLTAEVVKAGLMKMKWPARMEEIAPRVFLDGGHNEDGIRRFLEATKLLAGDRGASLIFSVVNDKDFSGMIRMLADEMPWKRIYVTEISGSRKTDGAELQRLFSAAGRPDARVFATFEECYLAGLEEQGENDLFIVGSLYLAGMAEALVRREKR